MVVAINPSRGRSPVIWSFLGLLQRQLVWAIPIAMVLGLAVGAVADVRALRPLILPVTILMIYPIMVTLDVRTLVAECRVRLLTLVLAANLVLLPLLGWGLGRLFLPGEALQIFGLLLMASLPTSGMTISWTRFAGGNVASAVKMTVLGLLLGSLLVPFYARLLMGQAVELPLGETIRKILLVVFVPLAAGLVTQFALRRRYGDRVFARDIKPHFPQISSLAVVAIIFIAMCLRSRVILAEPFHLLRLLPPLILFYLLTYTLATVVGRALLPRDETVVLVFSTAMRNLSLALALAMTVLGPAGAEAALVIAVAYVVQVQSAAWYVKRADRLVGASPSPAPARE
jgi:ACR3 family arsenite efflux pump ArsB